MVEIERGIDFKAFIEPMTITEHSSLSFLGQESIIIFSLQYISLVRDGEKANSAQALSFPPPQNFIEAHTTHHRASAE